MRGRLLQIGLVVAAAAVATAAGVSSQAATPGIPAFYVDYGEDCTYSMSVDPGIVLRPSSTPGAPVPPGAYQLLVSMPNPSAGFPCLKPVFTLTGPGVSIRVEFPGAALYDERMFTLQPSATYVAQDETAPASSRRVVATAASGSSGSMLGSAPPDTAKAGSVSGDYVGSAILRYRGKLAAAVTTSGRATLKLGGHGVSSLKAGKYDFVVDDEAARAGFFVRRGSRKAVAVSGLAFVGKRTQRVALAAGKWTFFSKTGGAPLRFTVVA